MEQIKMVQTSVTWGGPESNVLTLYVEPTPDMWEADDVDPVDFQIFVYRALDENEQETEEIAGVEIIGFLEFDRWDDLPKLPMLWQLPGWEPLPLEDLLKREQKLLREKEGYPAREQASAR